MADPAPTTTAPDAPIIVNANAYQPALEAAFRQAITVAGGVALAFGATHLSTEIGALAAVAGPIASLVAMGWGLWSTYDKAKKAVTMANALPDHVAMTSDRLAK